jgi:hypothetical protein
MRPSHCDRVHENLVADARARAGAADPGAAFFGYLARIAEDQLIVENGGSPTPCAGDVRGPPG